MYVWHIRNKSVAFGAHTHNFYLNTAHRHRTHPRYFQRWLLRTSWSAHKQAEQWTKARADARHGWDPQSTGTELRSWSRPIGRPVSVWVLLSAPCLARTHTLAGGRQAVLYLKLLKLQYLTECLCFDSQHNPVLNRESLFLDMRFSPIPSPNRTAMVTLPWCVDWLKLDCCHG